MQGDGEIFGSYELLNSLGRGGFGEAFVARRIDGSGERVVLKVLHSELCQEERFVKRFKHEAKVAVEIDSPFVVNVHELGSVGSTLYIAMEHIDGFTLWDLLTKALSKKQKISLEAALRLAAAVLSGLEALHNAVWAETGERVEAVHRDLTPRNIMIRRDGRPVIIDLGIGLSNARDWVTRTGALVGTFGYMSPEQARGIRPDARSDLYTLAIVLFELLALESYIPKRGGRVQLEWMIEPKYRPASRRRDDIPPELDELLQKALAVNPDERFATAESFRQAIERLAQCPKNFASVSMLLDSLFDPPVPVEAPTRTRLLPIETEPGRDTTVVFGRRSEDRTAPLIIAPAVSQKPAATTGISYGHVFVLSAGVATASALGTFALMSSSNAVDPAQLEPPREAWQPAARQVEVPAPEPQAVTEPAAALVAPMKKEVPKMRPAAAAEAPELAPATPPSDLDIGTLTKRAADLRRSRPDRRAEIDEALSQITFASQARDAAAQQTMLRQVAAILEAIE